MRTEPKRTISASGEIGLLRMVSEADSGWCASEDAGPQRGWIVRSHIVRSHIDWRGKRNIPCKGVETFP